MAMTQDTPVSLPGTAAHVLRIPKRDESVRLEISMPEAYGHTETRYPAVYLLDGHWYFSALASMVRLLERAQELPPLLVVGIGYEPLGGSPEEEYNRCLRLRCRDLTPTRGEDDWWRRAGASEPIAPGIDTGHGREYLQLIEDHVKPWVREHYRVDVGDETLAGHSLGGLCVLDVLFRSPGRYGRYLASSPSLWWDHEVIFDIERDYAGAHSAPKKDLFLCVGALEEEGPVAVSRMVSNVERLAQRLRTQHYPSLNWRTRILDEETHVTGVPRALVQGLKFLFTPRAERSDS